MGLKMLLHKWWGLQNTVSRSLWGSSVDVLTKKQREFLHTHGYMNIFSREEASRIIDNILLEKKASKKVTRAAKKPSPDASKRATHSLAAPYKAAPDFPALQSRASAPSKASPSQIEELKNLGFPAFKEAPSKEEANKLIRYGLQKKKEAHELYVLKTVLEGALSNNKERRHQCSRSPR